jgi:hypothetical protein
VTNCCSCRRSQEAHGSSFLTLYMLLMAQSRTLSDVGRSSTVSKITRRRSPTMVSGLKVDVNT